MAAVAQRQSSSPFQSKQSSISTKNDDNQEGCPVFLGFLGANILIANSPPKDLSMDTPSNYLVAEKFLAAEHNPFEQSFAIRPGSSSAGNGNGNGTDTPKPALPSVMEMFTPGGTNQYEHFAFSESLRHGPLSPNLLNGPTGPLPYDAATFRTGLTPNESNVRTGLTPGNTPGFPLLPTPGTAALLGAYTANTTAAIASMQSTTFPTVATFAPQAAARPPDVFGENQAANGLVFLAQTSHHQQQQTQQQQAPAPQNLGPGAGATREEVVKHAAANNPKAISFKEKEEQHASSKNQRTRKGKEDGPSNGKDNAKKAKIKSQETDDEKRKNFLERNRQGTQYSPSRPLLLAATAIPRELHTILLCTFVLTWSAALKCRQRKKQWLSSLQQKVDYYTRENDILRSEVGQLRDEVTTLKTLLAAHKDCSVAQQNGATPEAIAQAVSQASVFPVHAYR